MPPRHSAACNSKIYVLYSLRNAARPENEEEDAMKKLLARMFFTDNCAKGALFFLTVLTIGIFLWFSCFFIIAMALGTLPPLPLFRLCIIVVP